MIKFTFKNQYREAHTEDGARTSTTPPSHKRNEVAHTVSINNFKTLKIIKGLLQSKEQLLKKNC